jgi:hypothetical protein
MGHLSYSGSDHRHYPDRPFHSRAAFGLITLPVALGAGDTCQAEYDLKTTMIYTHVMSKGARGVRSPLDQK